MINEPFRIEEVYATKQIAGGEAVVREVLLSKFQTHWNVEARRTECLKVPMLVELYGVQAENFSMKQGDWIVGSVKCVTQYSEKAGRHFVTMRLANYAPLTF